MKKARLLILLLIISLIPFISIVSAQSSTGAEQVPLVGEIQEGQQKYEQFTTEQNKSDYLKREWGAILSKNKILGPIIEFLKKLEPIANPLFKYTTGMEPSLTWLFILNLILWFTILIMIKRALAITSPFSTSTQQIMSLGATIFLSLIGLTKTITQLIINALSLFNTWWGQLIGIVIIIAILIAISIISRDLSKISRHAREQKEKQELKSKVGMLEAREEVREEVEKSMYYS